jgi:hypothetical protein
MMSTVQPPIDRPREGCNFAEFSLWAADYRERRARQLVRGINTATGRPVNHPARIKEIVDLEVDAMRRLAFWGREKEIGGQA